MIAGLHSSGQPRRRTRRPLPRPRVNARSLDRRVYCVTRHADIVCCAPMSEWNKTADAKPDPELEAIRGVVALLEPLDDEARDRVVDYVFRRLGIELRQPGGDAGEEVTAPVVAPSPTTPPIPTQDRQHVAPSALSAVSDIRTLRDQKQPRNAVEMATLVGYYLAHAAPKDERADSFGSKELEKYCIQAGYPVPSTPRLVLFNAKKAGYLDAKSHGKYKTNAVGFNLIEHSLPAASGQSRHPAGPRRPDRRRTKGK